MTKKQHLAATYSILKHGVWAFDGVSGQNNSKKAHYKRAMSLMTIEDIEIQNDRLTHIMEKLPRWYNHTNTL